MYQLDSVGFGDLQVQTVHVHEAHVGANMGFMHMHCVDAAEARGESFRVIHKSPTHPQTL